MVKSIFFDIIGKYFPRIKKVIETFNGNRSQPTYLHEEMLGTEYSPDQSWTSSSLDTANVAADIVSIDSDLPIKRRDSLQTSGGKLPVMGMKLKLTTKQINDINIMINQGKLETEVVKKVLNDSIRCANGMRERMEAAFLEGLSNGVVGIIDQELAGENLMMRMSFGYLDKNAYGVSIKWGEKGATPISDIARVLSVATSTTAIMMDKYAYDLMRNSLEAREFVAGYNGAVIVGGATPSVPTVAKFNEAFASEYGVEIIVVNRRITTERNGKRTSYNPWNKDKVIFLADRHNVGKIVYGTHPEEQAEIAGVLKEKPLPYALLRKYSTVSPYEEITEIKGIAAPIIENVDTIYTLDISDAQVVSDEAEAQDSGDAKITIWGKAYDKAKFVKALNAITGGRLGVKTSDAKIIDAVNALSNEQESDLKSLVDAEV